MHYINKKESAMAIVGQGLRAQALPERVVRTCLRRMCRGSAQEETPTVATTLRDASSAPELDLSNSDELVRQTPS